MSLTQVLTRDTFHQSSTTPFAFFGSPASTGFLPDSKNISGAEAVPDFSYFSRAAVGGRGDQTLSAPDEHFVAAAAAASSSPAAETVDDLRLSSTFRDLKDSKPPASWEDHSSSHQPGGSMNNLHHVAQQSRREKLRIPGSLQPASPPASNNATNNNNSSSSGHHSGDHQAPAGSLVLEMRPQVGSGEIHESLNPDMLSVYGNQMLPQEVYSYSGSELLNAVSGKTTGYLEGLPPVNPVYNPPTGFTQSLAKASWPVTNLPGQLGQFNSSNSVSSSLQPGSGFGTTGRDLGSYFTTGANAQEAMQLYLMNAAGFAAFPDASAGAPPGSMVFIPGAAPAGAASGPTLMNSSQVSSPVGLGRGSQTYTTWKNGDELVFMPASDRAKPFGSNQESGLNELSSEYGMGSGGHQLVGNSQLSLSLSSQQPGQSLHAYDVLQQSGLDSPAGLSQDGKRSGKLGADLSHFRRDFQGKQIHIDGGGAAPGGASTTAMSASFNIISSSRYLKACQQLLEEVCSVGKGVKLSKGKSLQWSSAGPSPLTSPTSAATNNNNIKDGGGGAAAAGAPAQDQGSDHPEAKDAPAAAAPSATTGNNSSGTSGAGGAPTASGTGTAATSAGGDQGVESTSALSAEEKQELETKKTKLINMLQEVDRRYRQYYDQMQVVISSFDAVAGVGAATPYTALALQAMSRYFRCLKDAISGQISLVCKTLGEEDISKQITTKSPTSRLRFIDQQIRQQRAFQQLGMLNQHAWRPQRGLPERSVSILRAWLFEHFLHPYPKDADKMMLARQTGLTRSQVSNWFINARVRLWKPMVEEMYQDETREHELDVASRLHAAAAAAAAADSDPDGNNTTDEPIASSNKSKQLSDSSAADHFHDHNSGDPGGDHYSIPGAAASLRKQQQLEPQPQQLYEHQDPEQHPQLKKSRYSSDQGEYHHHMDVDLKPEQDQMHHLANGALHFGYDHHHHQQQQQQLRFANAAAAAAGFRYNMNPGPGSTGVSLTLGLQHSDGLNSPQAFLQHGGAAGAAAGFHLKNGGASGAGAGNGGATEHDFSSLYENAAAAAGLHEGMSYSSRKHIESQLLHDFVPS